MDMDPTTSPPTVDSSNTATSVRDRVRSLRRLIGRSEDRFVSGLAAGIAERLGISPAYVRAAFVVLTFAAGAGILLYLVGWGLTVDEAPQVVERTAASTRQKTALALIFLGVLVILESAGLWFGDQVVWPVALFAFGMAAMWGREGGSGRFARFASPSSLDQPGRVRVIAGAILMLGGLALVGSSIDAVAQLGNVVFAVLLTVAGFMLVFGPWVWRMAGELSAERRERIRQEERAEFAAHLHDSVLQTLALIQRSDDPKRMVTLARAQERELRGWLFGPRASGGIEKLGAAIEQTASRIEQDHDVPVEVVTVGDVDLDERTRAMVQAAGEAMTNAARHSGAGVVSAYVEAEAGGVDIWISDQGRGFDPAGVPHDRRGIADSIVGRMTRHGGTATITSAPGEGTEVHLSMKEDRR